MNTPPPAPIRRRPVKRRLEYDFDEPEGVCVQFIETTVRNGRVETSNGVMTYTGSDLSELIDNGFVVKTYQSDFFHQLVLIKKN